MYILFRKIGMKVQYYYRSDFPVFERELEAELINLKIICESMFPCVILMSKTFPLGIFLTGRLNNENI